VLGLVGKGITFDTGGISIKPADGMEKMKYDMAGGAAMLGAMRAIALLKPKVKIIAIVCATENMPSGKAQKPRRRADCHVGEVDRDHQYRRGRPLGCWPMAWYYARQLGCTHLIDCGDLNGRSCGRTRLRERRHLRQRREDV